MVLTVTFDRETDGRWIASVEELPGVHVYGADRDDALAKAQSLALSVLSDEIAHGERDPRTLMTLTFATASAA
jgi:predicted RNase H-like HicB family nuclease